MRKEQHQADQRSKHCSKFVNVEILEEADGVVLVQVLGTYTIVAESAEALYNWAKAQVQPIDPKNAPITEEDENGNEVGYNEWFYLAGEVLEEDISFWQRAHGMVGQGATELEFVAIIQSNSPEVLIHEAVHLGQDIAALTIRQGLHHIYNEKTDRINKVKFSDLHRIELEASITARIATALINIGWLND